MRPVLSGRYAVGGDDEHAVFMDKPAELLGARQWYRVQSARLFR